MLKPCNHWPIQGNQGIHVIYIIYKFSTLMEWGDRQKLYNKITKKHGYLG